MISIIIPVYNEKGNVKLLVEELRNVLKGGKDVFEIIIVDDGSEDGTFEELQSVASNYSKLRVIRFSRNFGQTAAFAAGISNARGDIIVTLDGDLENDPRDIPRLLNLLGDGYDLVSGWRKNRWRNKFIMRKFPSLVANWMISQVSGVRLHDYGCMLKIYRRDIIAGTALYGEMHRFIPVYARYNGARIAEAEVNYRPREYGATKYGISRTFRVLLDLLFIKFLLGYMSRPIHFFGGIGFASLFLGFLSGTAAVFLKVLGLRTLVSTPLPVLSAIFIIVGVQLIVMGILAEMIMRTYYESQQKTHYKIKERINF